MRKLTTLAMVGMLLMTTLAVGAQDAAEVATGLNSPRHLFIGSTGEIYIAEAGSGGTLDGTGPYGPSKYGNTARISVVSPEGELSAAVGGLPSMDAGFGQIEGPMAVYVTEDSYWVVIGMGANETPDHTAAVVQYDRATLEVGTVIDLGAFEAENNPDGAQERVSNPSDIAVGADGTLYIVDASGNSVIKWTADDGASLFAAWLASDAEPSAVPTAVAVSADGDIYIGFLSGFPFTAGSARIERYNVDGELQETFEGLTLVTDILLLDDGSLIAVQFADGFGDMGYNAGTGSVVMITPEGLTPLVQGLNFPYGVALDGTDLLITVDTFGAAPGSGRLIRLPMM